MPSNLWCCSYFVTTTCAAHIYHLLDDTLVPLYNTMLAMDEFSKAQDPDLEPRCTPQPRSGRTLM